MTKSEWDVKLEGQFRALKCNIWFHSRTQQKHHMETFEILQHDLLPAPHLTRKSVNILFLNIF